MGASNVPLKKPPSAGGEKVKINVGTGDGNRTRTPLKAQDFKSWASTNSATPARVMRLSRLKIKYKEVSRLGIRSV